ncbi:MAG: VWA domain-containing protein, partial [Actinobacteria bacterium]|nr:VWA domain-containing protein [Actinomycetota bacterium]
AIDPAVGGVLIRGERGTAKSTAVRGLAALLPEITCATCRYGCDPESENLCGQCAQERAGGQVIVTKRRQVRVVNLPVSATEDRVVGTLDLQAALEHGRREFEAGVLADAHRGILYVDEVNLLDDHLVDTLLDSAAMGVNRVEREGVAHSHPAEFILVGTMNPEEGDLRPQLLDRFGLAAEIRGDADPAARAEIVRRRVDFEASPRQFLRRWGPQTDALRNRIVGARAHLARVEVPAEMLALITHIAIQMAVDGHRADIVMYKTARALAAWEGREQITAADVRQAAEMALPHRRRRDPFTPPHLDEDELERAMKAFEKKGGAQAGEPGDGAKDQATAAADEAPASAADRGEAAGPQPGERHFAAASALETPALFTSERIPVQRRHGGRRTLTESKDRRGRSVRSRLMHEGEPPDLALVDTIRAAATRAGRPGKPTIAPEDYRIKRRTRKIGNLMLFVVDGSGSMAAQRRMALVKSAVLSLLADAYKRRDRVGVITFRKTDATETVPPTASLDLAHARMRDLPTGGRTPLAHGLDLARKVIGRERTKDPEVRPIMILLTDGVANVGIRAGSDPIEDAMRSAQALRRDRVPALVIDADQRRSTATALPQLARQMAATHLRLETLASGHLTQAIRLATA